MLGQGYNKPGDVQFLRSYDHNDSEVYPHPSVRVVRPGSHTWKYALTKYVLTKRALYIGITLCLLTVLLIIIVAAVATRGGAGGTVTETRLGLIYYPIPADGSNIIQYRAGDPNNYTHLLNNVTNFIRPYLPESQYDSGRVDCSHHKPPKASCRYNTADKIKDFTFIQDQDYGFKEAIPHVWLQLRLPVGDTPVTINKRSRYYHEVEKTLTPARYHLDYIGVSCQGKTPADDVLLKRGINETINYYPATGFAPYYFPATSSRTYLPPIVLVTFNTLHTNALVSVKCTAWSILPTGELSSTSDLYTTEFRLKVT